MISSHLLKLANFADETDLAQVHVAESTSVTSGKAPARTRTRRTMRRITQALGAATLPAFLLLSACQDPEEVPSETPAPLESPIAPTVTIDINTQMFHDDAVIEGLATDDGLSWTLVVTIESDVDGTLWRGQPDDEGHWAWQGVLSQGDHLLTVTAADDDGNETQAMARVHARGNFAPTCQIMSPIDGDHYDPSEVIAFEAHTADKDSDSLQILWQSDLEGALFEGDAWSQRLKTEGEHQVSVRVEDMWGGRCTHSVWIVVD